MKIVISPAKSLNFEKQLPFDKFSKPQFLKEAQQINHVLKDQSPKMLSELMVISDKLADLNWKRNQDWKVPFSSKNARPAVYTFDGDVYTGLDAYSIPKEKLEELQNRVRILSGLYGYLKPFDLIQPYRLEMGTKLPVGDSKNLYAFWRPIIAKELNKELKKGELFVNLASQEYFSAIDLSLIKVPVITPEFKEYKNGKLKIISFFAKKARGLMVRYIIDNQVETFEELKGFNYDGYCYDGLLSKENHIVFTR